MQAKLAARLSSAYDASAIGYRIDNADNTAYTAWTQADVSLLYAGYWDVEGLVALPDTGGTVHWGTSGTDIASVPFQPAPATAAQIEALGATASVTLLNIVDGLTIHPYQTATWRATVTLTGVALTDYQLLKLVIKGGPKVADSAAILAVDNVTGATLLNGAATTASYASLSAASATQFLLVVHQAATEAIRAGNYQWWLRGDKTSLDPDEQYYIATGDFIVEPYAE